MKQVQPHFPSKLSGFSLIELMISLTLGLLISGAVVQILVSNQVTERLNRSMASAQENGRFFISRIRAELVLAGHYDSLSPNLNRAVDTVEESDFLTHRPVVIPGDFANRPALGAIQGANGASDTLVIAYQGERDCRGYKLGYDDNEEFFVVNEYYVDGGTLKCRGFDGRYLRGQKNAEGHNNHAGFTLMDNVVSFQVLYGIGNNQQAGDFSARPIKYVTADQLAAERVAGSAVVAIRVAILVSGDGDVELSSVPSFKLLNETAVTPGNNQLHKQFETTVALRNARNKLRSQKIL